MLNKELLNDDQAKIFDEIIKHNEKKSGYKHLLLLGYAGTGKTFLLAKAIKELLELKPNIKIALTAPTNKAVKVLKNSFEIEDRRIEFMTIYKLLNLKMIIDAKGNQTFQADLFDQKEVDDYNVIVVDESSMLEDKLFLELNKLYNKTTIFMGDPKQIPPVNNKDNIIMNNLLFDDYSIRPHMLTKIMRQAEGNPIIELTHWIRDNLHKKYIDKSLLQTKIIENGGVHVYSQELDADKKEFVGNIKKYFVCEEFEKDADYSKVIAWKNDTVDYYNANIRKMIFGKDVTQYVIGEKLIADKPIVKKQYGGNSILFNTNDEFKIIDLETTFQDEYKCWRAVAEYEAENRVKKTKVIFLLHEESASKFRLELKRLEDIAKAMYKKDPKKAAAMWKMYYEFDSKFARVNYNYAITAHKSQGSSYMNVFVVEHDIRKNPDVIESNRIKYTAFSRPRKNLFVLT